MIEQFVEDRRLLLRQFNGHRSQKLHEYGPLAGEIMLLQPCEREDLINESMASLKPSWSLRVCSSQVLYYLRKEMEEGCFGPIEIMLLPLFFVLSLLEHFSKMGIAADSLSEERTSSEYQVFENKTWSHLTTSISPSLTRAGTFRLNLVLYVLLRLLFLW